METHSVEIYSVPLEGNGPSNRWKTKINGDKSSIGLYFITNHFNIGREEDEMVKVHHLMFEDGSRLSRCPNQECFKYVDPNGNKIQNNLNVVLQNIK